MWPLRKMLAIRFCLAYICLCPIDGVRRQAAHLSVPDDEYGATEWCVPFHYLSVGGRWVWERDDKLRGACHAALGILIANVISQAVAYYFCVKMEFYNMLVVWGAGCLGKVNIYWQANMLLQPMYDLTFWLCEKILRCISRNRKFWKRSQG